MLLSNGTKVLVCHRRLFPDDHTRLFFGEVEAYADGVAKVSGFTWARGTNTGYQRKRDRRTKLIALASGSLIVYELPTWIQLDAVEIVQEDQDSVIAVDGGDFRMDLSERV